MKSECITNYLHSLFEDFADNRRIIEPRWERNKRAYDMEPDGPVDQRFGVGNKRNIKDKKKWRSESVCDLTRVKTNAGKILVCDVLLVGGKVPLLIKSMDSTQDVNDSALSVPSQFPEPSGASADPGSANLISDTSSLIPSEAEGEDTDPALPMSNLMAEQLITANADIALQKAVMSAAIYGEGVSRIFTDQDVQTSWNKIPQGWVEQKTVSEVLRIRDVSIWDFFTDLENHDIQENPQQPNRRNRIPISIPHGMRTKPTPINLQRLRNPKNRKTRNRPTTPIIRLCRPLQVRQSPLMSPFPMIRSRNRLPLLRNRLPLLRNSLPFRRSPRQNSLPLRRLLNPSTSMKINSSQISTVI